MRIRVFAICIFILGFVYTSCPAQSIVGVIVDNITKKPIDNVNIENTFTGFGMLSDDQGKFFIAASHGQLLEFRKPGYKTVHVRIPDGTIPPYFKIILQAGPVEIPPYQLANKYQRDSLKYRQLYEHELDVRRMNGLDVIQHPFDAMSKTKREIWAFQDDYKETEKQKFVDNSFTPELITRLTGLTGDSLTYYMRRYRPSYEQVRNMNEYSFYNFIKHAADLYRSRGKSSPYRTSH